MVNANRKIKETETVINTPCYFSDKVEDYWDAEQLSRPERYQREHDSLLSSVNRIYFEGLELLNKNKHVSPALFQRELKISYAFSVKLLDEYERLGYIDEPDGAKPRKVLKDKVD